MARPKLNVVVLDPGSGKARPGAWVTFYFANTLTPTTLYADDDVSTLANPVQANQLGQVAVRVSPGLYDISMTWDGAQPTVVEDILAYTPETAVLTTAGDLIVGDATGDPVRLAVGLENQIFVVDQGLPAWKTLAANDGLPPGASGSLMSYGPTGRVLPILPGLQDQALAIMGGVPTWVSTLLPPGAYLPINQPGDLIVGQVTTGEVARLARGATDQVLTTADTGGLVWRTPVPPGGKGAGHAYLALAGTDLKLRPNLGSQLWIDGASREIPAAGVTLAPTGLTPDTTYYIYAAWTADVMTLEASPSGYAEAGGLLHKYDDPTRTLVGMARTIAGPAWTDTRTQRFVLSLYSTMPRVARSWFTAPRSITTVQEIHPEIRVEFLVWGHTPIQVGVSGMFALDNTGVTGIVWVATTLDGGNLAGHAISMQTPGLWVNNSLTTGVDDLAEGWHMVTLWGAVPTGGQATFTGDASGVFATRLYTVIPQ